MKQELFDFNTVTDSGEGTSSAQPKPYTVSGLNKRVKGCLEKQFDLIWVQAEISNFKAHSSGHWYFSLKDSKARVSAVMFRGHNSRMKFIPETGMEVLVRGRITVYEPRGNYQVFCESIEPVGAGALQKQFEQLKAKLQKQGLFDPKKKKPLPKLPKRIAVVTSPTGAAIRDILNVLDRRFRGVEVIVVPAAVQGPNAAPKILEAFQKANQINAVDAIIVGRGGGSMEDLWCFNDEKLAREISASKVPVISAVGHEIDFTISDFVADKRAPTPSAAAELVSASAIEVIQTIDHLEQRLLRAMNQWLADAAAQVHALKRMLVDPKQRLKDYKQRLQSLICRNQNIGKKLVLLEKDNLNSLTKRLVSPKQKLWDSQQKVEASKTQMLRAMFRGLETSRHEVQRHMAMLDAMSPLRVVDRGYAIVKKDNSVVKSEQALQPNDHLELRLSDGFVEAKVETTRKFNSSEKNGGLA